MIHVGEQLDKILSISIENSDVLNIPRCTHDIISSFQPTFWLRNNCDVTYINEILFLETM